MSYRNDLAAAQARAETAEAELARIERARWLEGQPLAEKRFEWAVTIMWSVAISIGIAIAALYKCVISE
jgi:hypothetical protein